MKKRYLILTLTILILLFVILINYKFKNRSVEAFDFNMIKKNDVVVEKDNLDKEFKEHDYANNKARLEAKHIKVIEENKNKGVYGPVKIEIIGQAIVHGILILALNYTIFAAPHPVPWWVFLLFNGLMLFVIYVNLFTENVRIKDDLLIYKQDFKKKTLLISNIVSIRKVDVPGYRGLPNPVLRLESASSGKLDVYIEKWDAREIVELLRFLKEKNKSVVVDKIFDPFFAASNLEEFKAAQKAYKRKETKGLLVAAFWSLAIMGFFFLIYYLGLLTRK
jgi:hypothetical protein